jgi:phosphoglucosamine mutase
MLEAALAAGVSAAGGEVLLGGVLPTPAAPLLIAKYGFDLAAVISASHNPYRDNGIKFFGADGFKLGDETEAAIERRLDEPAPAGGPIGRVRALHGTQEDYLRGLHERFASLDLSGRKVLLDCANGATAHVAPEIFRRLTPTSPSSPTSPTGATSTTASARPTSTRSPRASTATTSASRSTATATACWPSTAPARSSTATSCSRSPSCTAACPASR